VLSGFERRAGLDVGAVFDLEVGLVGVDEWLIHVTFVEQVLPLSASFTNPSDFRTQCDTATHALLDDCKVECLEDLVLVVSLQHSSRVLQVDQELFVTSGGRQPEEVVELVLFGVAVLLLIRVGVLLSAHCRPGSRRVRCAAYDDKTEGYRTHTVDIVRVHSVTALGLGRFDPPLHDILHVRLARVRVNVEPPLVPVRHLVVA